MAFRFGIIKIVYNQLEEKVRVRVAYQYPTRKTLRALVKNIKDNLPKRRFVPRSAWNEHELATAIESGVNDTIEELKEHTKRIQ